MTDEASARAAAPTVKKAIAAMEKTQEQLDECYDPEDVSGREAEAMAEELAKGIGDFQRMMQESMRIAQRPELIAALGDAWDALPTSAIMKAQGGGDKR